jgi:hypothetical protein
VTEDATSTAINKVFDFTFPKGDTGRRWRRWCCGDFINRNRHD